MLRAAFAAVILALAALPVAAVPVAELVAEKARDSFGPELPEDADFRITLQSAGISEAELISAFWMDRATGQFLANAVRADGGVTRLQGLAILTLEVPVPLRKMMPGEMLRESDLQMVELPYARLGSFALTDSARLIGKEVKRMLPRGRPIMAQSVAEPLVIARGDKVSIEFDDGRLALSAPGRALGDAHRWQEVRVVNLVSNALVTGIARADGRVEIIR